MTNFMSKQLDRLAELEEYDIKLRKWWHRTEGPYTVCTKYNSNRDAEGIRRGKLVNNQFIGEIINYEIPEEVSILGSQVRSVTYNMDRLRDPEELPDGILCENPLLDQTYVIFVKLKSGFEKLPETFVKFGEANAQVKHLRKHFRLVVVVNYNTHYYHTNPINIASRNERIAQFKPVED